MILFLIFHQSHIGSKATSIMAIYPENYEGKLLEPEFRNRGEEIGERKLDCPYCGKKGITYRKLLEKHAGEGESSQVVGIECSALGCWYLCRSRVV